MLRTELPHFSFSASSVSQNPFLSLQFCVSLQFCRGFFIHQLGLYVTCHRVSLHQGTKRNAVPYPRNRRIDSDHTVMVIFNPSSGVTIGGSKRNGFKKAARRPAYRHTVLEQSTIVWRALIGQANLT
ncbi:hypothetical protein AVEN_123655-1 [Araneus ventricosus]|uniref:Uncharacterized protein n=1 Tax=Araneus ventricosus TaxID=182803 RepID=A0A4Y2L850_ARAVE|nr:hypothetical protein AVEN_123655-1 [Araneus ventricosus]